MPRGSAAPLLASATLCALTAGCAREGEPPGGPPDRLPPIVIASEPDTFATVEPFREPVTFRFSERISERPSAGTLDQAVVVSPVSGEVRVSHGREGLTVRVLGGFEAGRVYRLTVRPVIQDMFGNSLQQPYELFFSTGPEFTSNVLAGSVVDRLTETRLPDVRVDAVAEGSDVVHTSVTDTAGIFALRYLPPGEYVVSAYIDRNRNGEPDFTEPQATRPAPLAGTSEATDTVIVLDVPLLPLDTTSARVARVTVEDSISLRVALDDYLDPEFPLDDVRVTVTSDSVDGVEATAVLHEHEVEAYRRELAEIIAREQAVQDSIASAQAAADSVPADSAAVAAGAPGEATTVAAGAAPGEGVQPPAGTEPEAAVAGEEPEERPLPQQNFFVFLDGVLVPEVPYEVEVSGITNISGVTGGGGTVEFTRPAPPPPDSVPGDTIPAGGDTLGVAGDTLLAAPGDTIARDTIPATSPGDTLAAPGDTIARDTIPAPPAADTIGRDTVPAGQVSPGDLSAPGDTVAAPADSIPPDTIPPPPGDSVRRDTIPPPPGGSVRRDTIPAPAGDSSPGSTARPPPRADLARGQAVPASPVPPPVAPGRSPRRRPRYAPP